MENKRGSHTGIMISFMIFVTVLISIYIIAAPSITKSEDKISTLNYIESKLIDEAKGDLIILTIINTTDNSDTKCLIVDNTDSIVPSGFYFIVKDSQNNPIISNEVSPNLEINWTDHEENFFKVYGGEKSLTSYTGVVENCTQASIESVRTDEHIFSSEINRMINDYEDNYMNFKTSLNTPPEDDFSFSFNYNNGTSVGTGQKNVSIDVFAKKISIQYIDEEANINLGELIINVW